MCAKMLFPFFLVVSAALADPAADWTYTKNKDSEVWQYPRAQLKVYEIANDFVPRAEKDCSTLNQVDESKFGRTRFQSLGICYSYATADLLTYALNRDLGTNNQVSALDIGITFALNHTQTNDAKTFLDTINSGGVPMEAFKEIAARNWVCPESRLTSDAGSYEFLMTGHAGDLYDQYQCGTDKLLDKVMRLKTEYNTTGALNSCTNAISSCQNISATTPHDFTGHLCFHQLGDPRHLGAALFSDENFKKYASQFANDAKGFVANIDNVLCNQPKARIDISAYKMFTSDATNPLIATTKTAAGDVIPRGDVLFPDLDRELGNGNPVEFEGTVGFIEASKDVAVGSDPHAMILIGRTYDQAKGCLYKIRNSWGADCSNYTSRVVNCDPNTGYFEVTEDDLRKNLNRIDFLGK